MTVAIKRTARKRSGKVLLERAIPVSPVMSVCFNLCEAMIIQQTYYWGAQRKHMIDGESWFYKTQKEWEADLGFFCLRTIRQCLTRLTEAGVLLVNTFNKHKYDQTRWYRLDVARVHELLLAHGAPEGELSWLLEDPAMEPAVVSVDPESGIRVLGSGKDLVREPEASGATGCQEAGRELGSATPMEPLCTLDVAEFAAPIPKTIFQDLKDLKTKRGGDEHTVSAVIGNEVSENNGDDMKLTKGLGAKEILAQHKQQRIEQREELKQARTPKQLELLWRTLLVDHCEVTHVRAFTIREYGMLKGIVKVCGEDHAAALLTCVCSDWVAFTKYATSHYGAFKCPMVPQVAFLLRFSDAAMNFWLTSAGGAPVVSAPSNAINCTEQAAPEVVPPSKPPLPSEQAPTPTKTVRVLKFGKAAKAAREAENAAPVAAPAPAPVTPQPAPASASLSDDEVTTLDFLKGLDLNAL